MTDAVKNIISGETRLIKLLLRLYLLIVLGGLFCPTACLADSTKAYLNAKEALARRDYAIGVKNYYRFVSFSEIVLSNSIKITDLAAAREFFEDASSSGDKSDHAKLFLALIDRITDNVDKAHEQIDFLREQHPRSLLLAYVKGELHLSQNQVAEAKPHFDWILNAAANSSFAVITRSLLDFYAGTDETAGEERKKFLLAAANRNWDLLEIDQAIRFFEIIARDFPHEQEAFKSLVQIYLDLDNTAKAREVYERWKSANTGILLAPVAQANFHCALEEYAEAAGILRKLLAADADNVQLKVILADCLFNLDDYEGALPLYQDLLVISPDDTGVVHRLKTCLAALGKFDETVALFESLAAGGSTNPWFQLELAELYLQAGNYEQSEVYFDLLSSAENPYSDYAAEMSAQIAQYRHEKALEEYEKAERLASAQKDQAAQKTPVAGSITARPSSDRVREVQVEELRKIMAIYE